MNNLLKVNFLTDVVNKEPPRSAHIALIKLLFDEQARVLYFGAYVGVFSRNETSHFEFFPKQTVRSEVTQGYRFISRLNLPAILPTI